LFPLLHKTVRDEIQFSTNKKPFQVIYGTEEVKSYTAVIQYRQKLTDHYKQLSGFPAIRGFPSFNNGNPCHRKTWGAPYVKIHCSTRTAENAEISRREIPRI